MSAPGTVDGPRTGVTVGTGPGARLKGQRIHRERHPLEGSVRYEGVGSAGMEILGGVMGYFLVFRPGQNAREVAVSVNEPALEFVAAELGREDTPALRTRIVELLGTAMLEDLLAQNRHIASAIMVSRATLEREPQLLDRVRSSLGTESAPPLAEATH